MPTGHWILLEYDASLQIKYGNRADLHLFGVTVHCRTHNATTTTNYYTTAICPVCDIEFIKDLNECQNT